MRPSIESRFWARVRKTDACWLWNTPATCGLYGGMEIEGKRKLAHRISWEMHYGDIPKGLQVCHKCDTPRCVRPDHLFLGTQKENIADALRKGRFPLGARNGKCTRPDKTLKGGEHYRATLTDEDVIHVRMLYALAARHKRRYGVVTALAKQFGLSVGTIKAIITRRTWKHI